MENNIEKNINERWLDNFYESLLRLQYHQKMILEGCESLQEYVLLLFQTIGKNPNKKIMESFMARIQHKNYLLFMNEIQIILNNNQNLIEKTQYNLIKKKYEELKNLEEKGGSFIKAFYDQIHKNTYFYLKKEFNIVKKEVPILREMLINASWKYLSPSAQENLGETKKSLV